MALSMLSSTFLLRNNTIPVSLRKCFLSDKSFSGKPAGYPVQCVVANTEPSSSYEIGGPVRRTANYHAPIWDYDYVQSLKSEYMGETCMGRFETLKREVKMMLEMLKKPLDQLEMIDLVQRLGISYQFEDEIKRLLNRMYCNYDMNADWKKDNLYATALEFRILRQHGFSIRQDVFSSFKDDETGDFKECLAEDIQGILCLYESSYLSMEGENTLEKARDFAKTHLETCLRQQNTNEDLVVLVSHALEIPLHWRVLRLEARWFIDAYERSQHMNPVLLDLAKLDYNMVQATHQEDLKYASRWWRYTGLGEKLSFARDRLMENFLWTVGIIYQPQFGYCRRIVAKVNSLITTIDDVYDVYGTLDELELFTDAVDRWDIKAMDQLPEYMKICFLALYNSINEMAYDLLKEQGSHIIPSLRKSWADLCKAYLVEAKWYHAQYTPTLQEYLDNAWTSIGAHVILVHTFFSVTNPITEEAVESLEAYSSIIRWSSILLRLWDDLGTSSDELKRGDVLKSMQCYMNETGASEEEAREHIKWLIGETWKKMEEDRVLDSPFSQTFIGTALNVARMAQCMYQNGDGHGIEDGETKDRVFSLMISPIPLV